MKPIVSLVKYSTSPDSLRQAIDLCGGLSALKPGMSALIKPNLVGWDDLFPFAPYGVYTTTRLVEDCIIILKDHGIDRISIGEGSVEIKKGVGTRAAYKGLGYEELAKKYGVTLVDFNESKSEAFEFHAGHKLHIAKEAIETDFFINFPVLKTHGQTKVSLGLKNLKGCLKVASKKLCHHAELDLEYCFSFIADFVKPALTIVDGIYALEKGALHYGNAYRKDVIIASTDPLGADLVAAHSIGYGPGDIAHFGHYGKRTGRSLDLDAYEVKGETLADHVKPLKWDWLWTEDNTGPGAFAKMGITGPGLPKYDSTLCSGCSPLANMANILVMSAFKGQPLPKTEILNGKKMQARPGYDRTIMLGNCIIKANKGNKNVKEPIEVTGCPPAMEDVVASLKSAGFDVNEMAYLGYSKQQAEKYNGKEGYDPGFFRA
jgi:uncharacterized protein (DUF362 family)